MHCQLNGVLEHSRDDAAAWRPYVCLVGPEGSGKTTIATQFMLAAQRAVSCALTAHLNDELRSMMETRLLWSPEVMERRDAEWRAYRSALEHNGRHPDVCLAHCAPASWLPEGELRRQLENLMREGRYSAPVGVEPLRPSKVLRGELPHSPALSSPGNRSGDRRRRTTMLMLDDADKILLLRRDRRREWIARATDHATWGWKWPLTYAFIGSPAVAEELSSHGKVHVIRLDGMPLDDDWRELVRRVFGTDAEADRLHFGTQGCVGPLLYAAKMRGLKPPFGIPDAEIRRLPPPGDV